MTFQEDVERMNLKNIIIGSIITALGFLVALSWRDAMQAFINSLVPSGEGVIYKFIAATIITFIVVVIAFIMIKISQRSITKTMESVLTTKKRSRRLVRSRIQASRA